MNKISKHHIPLIFIFTITIFWSYFYQSSNYFNDFSTQKPEWLLLIDGLIVLPILCFICIKDKKEAVLKALVYACLIILLGSFIIPESSKFIWHLFESTRYWLLAGFVIAEVVTLITVFIAVRASLNKDLDPDKAIVEPIENILGSGMIGQLISFEARVWTYALFAKKIKPELFSGEEHFSCHNKDGAQSNQLGFILMMLFELPLMHLLLHFIGSPFAANLVTGITLLGFAFFVAEYKALAIRPISLAADNIFIRYGVWQPLVVAYNEIALIKINKQTIARASHIKRYNLVGAPNVEIKLNSGHYIYLGLDKPNAFVSSVEKKIALLS
jgi:hypothetical protein